jgi:hypothetical protein
MAAAAYEAASHERAFTGVTLPTTFGNITWAGFTMLQTGTGNVNGPLFLIDVDDRFVKASTHVLTFTDPLTLSWARA